MVFVEAATSVADGTRDAALEAARMSADAKDVAAFNAGNQSFVRFPVVDDDDLVLSITPLIRFNESIEGTRVETDHCSRCFRATSQVSPCCPKINFSLMAFAGTAASR